MAALKPVPGQILLTRPEADVLRDAVRNEIGGTTSDVYKTARLVVEATMARLNQQRCGDPAGVIRRSENGSIAVREQNEDGALHWNVTYLDDADTTPTASDIRAWERIPPEPENAGG
jgi:hypothetical protein